jgi:hypothetical protein
MSTPSARTLTLKLAFGLGGEAYLRTRPDRLPGLVTGLLVQPGAIAYRVAWGDGSESSHFAFELSAEFDPESPAAD